MHKSPFVCEMSLPFSVQQFHSIDITFPEFMTKNRYLEQH